MHRNIILLALFNFFTDLIFYAPVAIIYFSSVSGSYALGMSVFSVVMIANAFFEVPTGVFSDRIGRKNTVIVGTIATLISAVLYAIGGSYGFLVLGAVFEGLGRSFYSGNNDALLHDTLAESTSEDKYHEYQGKLSSLFQLALALSAVVGGVLAYYSFALVMWVSVFPKVVMLGISLFLIEPKVVRSESTNIFAHIHEAVRLSWQNQKLRYLNIASMIRYALGESAYLFRGAFVQTLWPIWAIGFSNVISNIGAALGYFYSGTIINKYSAKTVLTMEIIINRCLNLVALLFPSVISPALMGTTSLSYGSGQVAMNMLLQKEFSSKQRATMGSLNSLGGSLLFAISAFFLGYIGDILGPAQTLIGIHILLLTPLYFYRKIFRSQ